MTELVQHNLAKAQQNQKTWYDRTARAREFGVGDKVIVLLPTSTQKLRAQWQGPYTIIRKLGEANYIVDMRDKEKRYRTFHVNMLKRWYEATSEHALFTTQTEGDDIMLWDDRGDEDPSISEHLTTEQRLSLLQLIEDFRDVYIQQRTWTNYVSRAPDRDRICQACQAEALPTTSCIQGNGSEGTN